MLQKEFFQVQPFNPNPYWDPVIINLSGAQKFEEETVFVPGRYKVVVQAGGAYVKDSNSTLIWDSALPARITQIISVRKPFVVRGYCGQKSFVLRNSSAQTVSKQSGVNAYSGAFKVNAETVGKNIPAVSHIFGNAGSCGRSYRDMTPYQVSSGNCLGNGAVSEGMFSAAGAGSCLHLLPVGGEFGSNYLYAFHVTSGAASSGGGGSAYGGAASGNGYQGVLSWNGGSTSYGSGGAASGSTGIDGSGVGHGKHNRLGAGAWFNGGAWVQSDEVADSYDQDGIIKVEYLGPTNE